MEPDKDHLCGSTCTRKHTKCGRKPINTKNGYKNILDRWNNDVKYRKSLSDMGGAEEGKIQYDNIASEDYSHNATREKKEVGTRKHGNSYLNAEGVQGPLESAQ